MKSGWAAKASYSIQNCRGTLCTCCRRIRMDPPYFLQAVSLVQLLGSLPVQYDQQNLQTSRLGWAISFFFFSIITFTQFSSLIMCTGQANYCDQFRPDIASSRVLTAFMYSQYFSSPSDKLICCCCGNDFVILFVYAGGLKHLHLLSVLLDDSELVHFVSHQHNLHKLNKQCCDIIF